MGGGKIEGAVGRSNQDWPARPGAREMSEDLSASNAAQAARETCAEQEETRILSEEMQALLATLEIYIAIAEAWRDSRLIKGGRL
jgi:hypothetical protein